MTQPERQKDLGAKSRLGPVLAWIAALGAVVVFAYVYWPAREQAARLESERAEARGRIARMHGALERMEGRCAALRSREPEALREAIREVLRKGRRGEYILGE